MTRRPRSRTRKRIATVIAHEMAHQWFGDLVTMRWWDDLWLNEGFATWMETRPLAATHPEWNIDVDEAIGTQTALNLDALRSTRPIHSNAETPAEIEETFDIIAYQKGAAVLQHDRAATSATTTSGAGVNAYLAQHAYANATSEDFWRAIALASRKPVDRILPTFVNQPGVPLVNVSLSCAGNEPDADAEATQVRAGPDSRILVHASRDRPMADPRLRQRGQRRISVACSVMAGAALTSRLSSAVVSGMGVRQRRSEGLLPDGVSARHAASVRRRPRHEVHGARTPVSRRRRVGARDGGPTLGGRLPHAGEPASAPSASAACWRR